VDAALAPPSDRGGTCMNGIGGDAFCHHPGTASDAGLNGLSRWHVDAGCFMWYG
jgi:hypothetical protein